MLNFFRRFKKVQKVPMIILVVILSIGLVGSFAAWSVPQSSAKGSKLSLEELDKKIAELEEEIKENPNDTSLLINLAQLRDEKANLLLSKGKTDESKKEYEKNITTYQDVLKKQPKNLSALYGLANAASNLDKKDIEQDALNKALAIQEENMNSRIENAKKELDKDPNNLEKLGEYADLQLRFANIYYLHNAEDKAKAKFSECIDLNKEILEKDPKDKEAPYRIAEAAFKTGNMDLAKENYKKAIELDSKNPEKRANYVIFLMSINDFEGALKQAEEALNLNPDENLKANLETYKWLIETQLNAEKAKEQENKNKDDNKNKEE